MSLGRYCTTQFSEMIKCCVNRMFSSANRRLVFDRQFNQFEETKHTKGRDMVLQNCRRNFCRANVPKHLDLLDVTSPRRRSLYSAEDHAQFMSIFPQFVEDMLEVKPWSNIPEVRKQVRRLLEYHAPFYVKFRGLFTPYAYKKFEKPENLTPENIHLSIIVGWCAELLEFSHLIADDMEDNSKTRCGVTCWHRLENAGNVANDILFMRNTSYYILKKYLSHHPQYVRLNEVMHEVDLQTTMGQTLDLARVNFDKFNMNYYKTLSVGKHQYMNCYFPVILAMYFANINDPKLHLQAKNVVMELALFYNMQNDFIDIFDDDGVTDKDSGDIEEGKLSWLAVTALQRANPAQRKVMEQYYGKPGKESVEAVRSLYEELNIPQIFMEHRDAMAKKIEKDIQNLPQELSHDVFWFILDVYKCTGYCGL